MVIPSHVDVDLDVINNGLTSDITVPSLRFRETRTSPYTEGDSADYVCSIIRFSVQTGSSLPVFIPRIELGQPDVNKTVYAITLKIQGTFGRGSHCFTQPIQLHWILLHPRQHKRLRGKTCQAPIITCIATSISLIC